MLPVDVSLFHIHDRLLTVDEMQAMFVSTFVDSKKIDEIPYIAVSERMPEQEKHVYSRYLLSIADEELVGRTR